MYYVFKDDDDDIIISSAVNDQQKQQQKLITTSTTSTTTTTMLTSSSVNIDHGHHNQTMMEPISKIFNHHQNHLSLSSGIVVYHICRFTTINE